MRFQQALNRTREWWSHRNGTERLEISFQAIIALATIAYVTIATLQWSSMKQSNQIARESLITVQRASISFGNVNGSPVLDKPMGKIVGYQFTRTVTNDGSTPAKDVRVWRDWKALPEFPANFAYSERFFNIVGPVMGSKQTIDVTPIFVPIRVLLDATKKIRFWGTARYYDIFKDTPEHVTEVCVDIVRVGEIDKLDNSGTKTLGDFHFPPCDKHNCADEQCVQQ